MELPQEHNTQSIATVTFSYDNNVPINYPQSSVGYAFAHRVNAEKTFRTIVTYLINANIINGNIIDAGCWIGDNAILWAKNIKGLVYAIDPSYKNIEFVNTVAKLNAVTNLITIQTALSDKRQFISTNNPSASGPGGSDHCSYELDDSKTTKINASSLDELYTNTQINNIGFIHLDVEGFEALVIRGSQTILSTFRPIVAFEQHINTDDYVGLCNWFKSQQYMCVLIDETFRGTRKDCRNLLAIPNNTVYEQLLSQFNTYLLAL